MRMDSRGSFFRFFLLASVLSVGWSPLAHTQATPPKYGPLGSPKAIPLSQRNDYFKDPKKPAPDFWSLIPYYVPQFNGAACGVASLSMVLNAARTQKNLSASDPLITQQELLNSIPIENWKSRILGSLWGLNPFAKRGTPLEVLGRISKKALEHYQIPGARVEVRHFDSLTPETLQDLRRALAENEANPNNWIIVNFNQKALTDDAEVGHLAPVGAYDSTADRVLIFDPDREWYEPYWVKTEDLALGMNTLDSEQKRFRGYLILTRGSN